MKHDILDHVIDQWQTEFPELDCQAMAVVGRILRLAGHLERRANAALKPFDLPIWGFDVLGALRDLSDELKSQSGMSIAQCEYWSDTLDRWAEDLVDPAGGGT